MVVSKKKSEGTDSDSGFVSMKSGDTIEMMKSFGVAMKGNKKVYNGGGHVAFLHNNELVRMVPGQVKKVPKQVIEQFNSNKKPDVFVEPGSQKLGDEVKD